MRGMLFHTSTTTLCFTAFSFYDSRHAQVTWPSTVLSSPTQRQSSNQDADLILSHNTTTRYRHSSLPQNSSSTLSHPSQADQRKAYTIIDIVFQRFPFQPAETGLLRKGAVKSNSFQLARIRPQRISSPTRILPLHWDGEEKKRFGKGGKRDFMGRGVSHFRQQRWVVGAWGG